MSGSRAGYMRELRGRRRRDGSCMGCGGVRDEDGLVTCRGCRERNRKRAKEERVRGGDEYRAKEAMYQRRWRAKVREEGMCTQCGHERDVRDMAWCSRCRLLRKLRYVPRSEMGEAEREERRARDRVRGEDREYRKRRVLYTREHRARLKAEGKCQECGWAPVWREHSRCRMCHEKELEKRRKVRGKVEVKRRCRGCRDVLAESRHSRVCVACEEAGMNRWKAQAMGDRMRGLWEDWKEMMADR